MPTLDLSTILLDASGEQHAHIDQKKSEDGEPLFYDAGPLAGQPVMEYKGPLRLAHVLYMAANSPAKDETLKLDELVKRGKLARKVLRFEPEASKTFSSKEIDMLVSACEKRYAANPEMFTAILEHLDPEREELKLGDDGAGKPQLRSAT